jgi:hypothetical protein
MDNRLLGGGERKMVLRKHVGKIALSALVLGIGVVVGTVAAQPQLPGGFNPFAPTGGEPGPTGTAEPGVPAAIGTFLGTRPPIRTTFVPGPRP